jgi:hypothetical protein
MVAFEQLRLVREPSHAADSAWLAPNETRIEIAYCNGSVVVIAALVPRITLLP